MTSKLRDRDNCIIKNGQKVRVVSNIPTNNGMIYKNSIVKVSGIIKDKIRVTDNLGKIWHVSPDNISVKYL